jgi:hypothetical protein
LFVDDFFKLGLSRLDFAYGSLHLFLPFILALICFWLALISALICSWPLCWHSSLPIIPSTSSCHTRSSYF